MGGSKPLKFSSELWIWFHVVLILKLISYEELRNFHWLLRHLFLRRSSPLRTGPLEQKLLFFHGKMHYNWCRINDEKNKPIFFLFYSFYKYGFSSCLISEIPLHPSILYNFTYITLRALIGLSWNHQTRTQHRDNRTTHIPRVGIQLMISFIWEILVGTSAYLRPRCDFLLLHLAMCGCPMQGFSQRHTSLKKDYILRNIWICMYRWFELPLDAAAS